MGFRITTNMMMSTYRFNLMNDTNKLSDSIEKVQTKRNFNSYAEDPAAAAQEFRLRRDWYQTNNQLDNNDATYSKFHIGWTNLAGIITNLSDANARVSAIRGNSGTAGESRTALAQVLRQTSESVIQAMNQKVGEQFIFAGNDGLNVPFSWSDDHSTLYYRGINVNAGSVERPAGAEPAWAVNKDEYGLPDMTGLPENLTETDKEWLAYYNDQSDLNKLKKMSSEELNIDMGMGLAEVNGKLVNGSAFNTSLPGINFVGYGVDADGDPQNMALVMRELADVFETWGENGQMYLPEEYRDTSYEDIQAILDNGGPEADRLKAYHAEQEEKAFRLMDKLNAAQEHTDEMYVELDARSSFLKTNSSRLTDQVFNLNESVIELEQINLADAITQLSWDQMCYNAALKIGTQLLSQSLIDYMG